MNTRIRELALQAGQHADTYDDTGTAIWFQMYNEKFAELIVRECARAIITDSRLNDVRSAANGCVRTINEHFGVER